METINTLTGEDVFRSQFRSKKEPPPSNITIIDWGLKHIERIRKSSMEKRGER